MEIQQLSRFDATVTSVFKSLLESFPTPLLLDATAAGYETVAGYVPVEGSLYGEKNYIYPTEDELFFASTVHWLATERYLIFKKEDDCRFVDVVLTEKGLKLWNALPNCLTQ